MTVSNIQMPNISKKRDMMNKKIPMRRCVGCGQSKPKQELVRIIVNEDGTVSTDKTGRANGRGIYICSGSEECFVLAKKKNAIARGLHANVSPENTEALHKEFAGHEK